MNDSTDTFISTSANKNPFAAAKYSFTTVLINECFAIKNKCSTTHFLCMYYKKFIEIKLNVVLVSHGRNGIDFLSEGLIEVKR